MKKFNIFQKVLISIMTIVFILTVVFGIFKASVLDNVNKEVFNMVTAVRYTFFEAPIQASKNWVSSSLSLSEVRKENDLLKENAASIGRYQAEINELLDKNKKLEEMIDFKNNNSDLILKPARVIFRDFERWNNIIKIDVGANDGIKVNNAVVLADGLVGRVEEVMANTSMVRLIVSNEKVSKVAIKIKLEDDKYVEGIIDYYDSNLNKFQLSLLDTSDAIKEDQVVTTSGSGGTIPSGILLGYIDTVEPSVSQLGAKILVRPSASFESFESVYVVSGSQND